MSCRQLRLALTIACLPLCGMKRPSENRDLDSPESEDCLRHQLAHIRQNHTWTVLAEQWAAWLNHILARSVV